MIPYLCRAPESGLLIGHAPRVVQLAHFGLNARVYAAFTRCFPQGFPQKLWTVARRGTAI
jgi:hypothetical protein